MMALFSAYPGHTRAVVSKVGGIAWGVGGWDYLRECYEGAPEGGPSTALFT